MPISLAINGVKFEVPSCVDPTTSLNEYLRCNTPFKVKCCNMPCVCLVESRMKCRHSFNDVAAGTYKLLSV